MVSGINHNDSNFVFIEQNTHYTNTHPHLVQFILNYCAHRHYRVQNVERSDVSRKDLVGNQVEVDD